MTTGRWQAEVFSARLHHAFFYLPAASFYTDPDPPRPEERSAGMGLAVVAAARSDFGRWQVLLESSPGGAEGELPAGRWVDLPGSLAPAASLLVPPGLREQQTYRGPLAVAEYCRMLACAEGAAGASPTGAEDAGAWEEVRGTTTAVQLFLSFSTSL